MTDITPYENLFLSKHDKYIEASTAKNTRLTYQHNIASYKKLGFPLPATVEDISSYLDYCAEINNPSTIQNRLTALAQWHRLQGLPDPTDNDFISKKIKGIRKANGREPRRAAAPDLENLADLVNPLNDPHNLHHSRNRALILVGYFGAMRQSEVANLQWHNIEFVKEGMVITIPFSKTDQYKQGQRVPIPAGIGPLCAVKALADWQVVSKLRDGYIFCRISKTGTLHKKPITSAYVRTITKELAKQAHLPNAERYTGHCLRRGFTTKASREGASIQVLQKHGRWKYPESVIPYIELGREFEDSAVKVLMGKK